MINTVNILKVQEYAHSLSDELDKELNALKDELKGANQEITIIKQNLKPIPPQFDDSALKVAMKKLDRKINRTLASQAALANLFQPYSVGKLNLTAAVGGYKSEQAVAIGTGYRFNERFAARASVSFVRGGSATYGAGINFEY